MTRSILPNFSTDLAQTVLENIQLQRQQYYYFIGRTYPWGTVDRVQDDPIEISQDSDRLIRSNMVFTKRIEKNNVSLVATRYDWVQDTVIPQWDNTIQMDGVGFYVVTDEDKVYSCLDNAENQISTTKPQSESFYPHNTPDGYTWKYLYTIPAFKKKNFTTLNYIPVQNAIQDTFYSSGALENVIVREGGSGYFNAPLVLLQVTGTTSGSGATVELQFDELGSIINVIVLTGGQDYTHGCAISIESATGSGAKLTPVITAGVLTGVDITQAGIGYQIGDTATVYVGGAELVPRIRQQDGQFDQIEIKNPGAGYTSAPAIIINYTSGTPGISSGKYDENPTALLEAITSGGSIVDVLLRDPGINYPVDSETILQVQGDGEGAKLTPIISNGELVDIIIDDPGIGYNTATVNVIGPGSGAVVDVVIQDSNFQSNQSVIEQTAINGGIHSIRLTESGIGYSSRTTVSVVGDGVGCTAEVILGLAGQIARIVVTNPGVNYSHATVQITDPSRTDVFGTLVDATAYAIIQPRGGHGSDVIRQLRGSTIAINTPLRTETEASQMGQEFRQFGIIKNPRTLQSNRFFRGTRDLLVYRVLFDTTAGLIPDELLTKGQAQFRVIKIDSVSNVAWLQQINNNNILPQGVLLDSTGTRAHNGLRILQQPTVDKYSGRLLYISNENPFSFNENQGIVIRTFLDL